MERQRAGAAGRSGAVAKATARGRQVGTTPGLPRGGKRLDLLATLRTAAPWQRLRGATLVDGVRRLAIRAEDLRIRRLRQRIGTTVCFAVDASGSQALNRLGEAKGAIELLLAESYVRRDRVALVVFRGKTVEIALPPTRSLARAKRTLAGLPGGGGTPLASGLDAVGELAMKVKREGGRPLVVLLTDGRANIARDGTGGRPRAEAEADVSARRFGSQALPALVVDTSPRPNPALAALAKLMGARYAPLPVVRADTLGAAVRAVMRSEPA
jgi:magnesium chelatase subunit D